MHNHDYIAFIVEGEVREPQIIENMKKNFFSRRNIETITLSSEENIYMLWKVLKEDDFETDIIEVLREQNPKIKQQLDGISRDDFSEIYLFFDYDAHQKNISATDSGQVIEQMLECFDNETENGKLYISYPMVEALRDYWPGTCNVGTNCIVAYGDFEHYKDISGKRSANPQLKKYIFTDWTQSTEVFAMRISCLFGMNKIFNYKQFRTQFDVNPLKIYQRQIKLLQNYGVIVISAFPEFLIDYFGERYWRKSVKYSHIAKCNFYISNQKIQLPNEKITGGAV